MVMPAFVTIKEAKDALQWDGDDKDLDFQQLVDAASSWVVGYLKSGAAAFVDETGAVIATAPHIERVRRATIYLVGVMLRNPDNDTESAFDPGYPPAPVVSLLYDLRDPALA